MPRTTTFEIVTDTSHFTPLQLQAKAALSISFNALSRWLREHLVSFPSLIKDQRFSVVILGVSLQYEKPLGFFEADALQVRSSLRVLRGGTRAQLDTEFGAKGTRAATVRILLCPVEVIDPASLGAQPGTFPGRILERFRPDEIDPGSPERPLPPLKTDIEQTGTLLGKFEHPFVIHRHHCEVADQWAFYEVPALTGGAREAFAQQRGHEAPLLRAALGEPLRRFEMELSRPYFWLQPGSVETTAYRFQDRLARVHRLLSTIPGEKVYGTIVELF